MNEKRASMIGKLKSVEKEVEGLAAKKEVAEAYLGKQAERLNSQITGNKLRLLKTQVCRGWVLAGRTQLAGAVSVSAAPALQHTQTAHTTHTPQQRELTDVDSKAAEFEARLEHENSKLESYSGEMAGVDKGFAGERITCCVVEKTGHSRCKHEH